jgi:hypothetical protein
MRRDMKKIGSSLSGAGKINEPGIFMGAVRPHTLTCDDATTQKGRPGGGSVTVSSCR